MSHYTVAVISRTGTEDEVNKLLAPFYEGMEVEEYVSRTRREIIEEGKANKELWLEKLSKEDTPKETLIEVLTHPSYDRTRRLLAAETDQDFYEAEAYSDSVGPDGDELSTYNPDSKWDWYDIGGRWSGDLRGYDGEGHNVLQIKDWDYNYVDPEAIKYRTRFWEIIVEGAEPTEEEKEEFFSFYKPEYYIEKYGNKSDFVKNRLTFSTWAVLTPDGEWLEPGAMGWFGCSTAEPKEEGMWERDYTHLIDTFDRDYFVTLVDCHI